MTKIDKRMVQTICTVCGGNLANFPKRIRVAVLVAAALLATASGCGKSDSGNEATLVPEVTVTTVRKGSLVQNLTVSGNLTALPNRDAKIAALVPGRIERVLVTEGDSVRPGQVVAQVDPASLRDQLVQADAAVSQARANVENARIAAERNEGLLQRGIAARKEVEDAKTQLSVNQAQLKQAEAARSAARTQVNRSELRAPEQSFIVFSEWANKWKAPVANR